MSLPKSRVTVNEHAAFRRRIASADTPVHDLVRDVMDDLQERLMNPLVDRAPKRSEKSQSRILSLLDELHVERTED